MFDGTPEIQQGIKWSWLLYKKMLLQAFKIGEAVLKTVVWGGKLAILGWQILFYCNFWYEPCHEETYLQGFSTR